MSENEVVDAIRQWLTIFALIGIGSLIWVFSKPEKRNKFIKEGTLDLRAFWHELRATFGAGTMAFLIFFASMLGIALGAAIFR